MINLTEDQKKRIIGEIDVLSEVISDLSSVVKPGERGGISLAHDDFRERFGVDLIIDCPVEAQRFVEIAFSELGIEIRKHVKNEVYNVELEVLGMTLEEYKRLLKGSIILFLEFQKDLAMSSPEGKTVKFTIKKEIEFLFNELNSKLTGEVEKKEDKPEVVEYLH